jgi:hypothetical protein
MSDPLTQTIREAVRAEIAAFVPTVTELRPALLTTKELAHELRCCTKTIDRLRKEGLPHMLVGDNCPRYRLEAVVSWLESRPSVSTTEGRAT